MSETTVVSTRIPTPYVRSLRAIAELRRTTVSDVLSRIVVEQVEPTTFELTTASSNANHVA